VKGYRPVYFHPSTGFEQTPIYDLEQLTPGNTVTGPAVIEVRDTTILLSQGRRYIVDELGNGIIERVDAAALLTPAIQRSSLTTSNM
jgi:N-methylhydantoinase A